MGVFETLPYTNFQNLNLDYILRKLAEIEADVAEVVELSKTWSSQVDALNARMLAIENENKALRNLYNTFVDEVNTKFNELEAQLIADFETLRADIDNRFNILEQYIASTLADLDQRMTALDRRLDDTLNNLPSLIIMRDPFTGEDNNLTNIINELASINRVEAITAGEYDALLLDASVYDAKEITAYNYDWYGKTILMN